MSNENSSCLYFIQIGGKEYGPNQEKVVNYDGVVSLDLPSKKETILLYGKAFQAVVISPDKKILAATYKCNLHFEMDKFHEIHKQKPSFDKTQKNVPEDWTAFSRLTFWNQDNELVDNIIIEQLHNSNILYLDFSMDGQNVCFQTTGYIKNPDLGKYQTITDYHKAQNDLSRQYLGLYNLKRKEITLFKNTLNLYPRYPKFVYYNGNEYIFFYSSKLKNYFLLDVKSNKIILFFEKVKPFINNYDKDKWGLLNPTKDLTQAVFYYKNNDHEFLPKISLYHHDFVRNKTDLIESFSAGFRPKPYCEWSPDKTWVGLHYHWWHGDIPNNFQNQISINKNREKPRGIWLHNVLNKETLNVSTRAKSCQFSWA